MALALLGRTFSELKLSHGVGVTRRAPSGRLWNTLPAAPSEAVRLHGREALV